MRAPTAAHGWCRIEDIDAPRTVPGAADHILRTLEAFGFEWDGEVVYQSRRLDLYHAALVRLQLAGLAYPCSCSAQRGSPHRRVVLLLMAVCSIRVPAGAG